MSDTTLCVRCDQPFARHMVVAGCGMVCPIGVCTWQPPRPHEQPAQDGETLIDKLEREIRCSKRNEAGAKGGLWQFHKGATLAFESSLRMVRALAPPAQTQQGLSDEEKIGREVADLLGRAYVPNPREGEPGDAETYEVAAPLNPDKQPSPSAAPAQMFQCRKCRALYRQTNETRDPLTYEYLSATHCEPSCATSDVLPIAQPASPEGALREALLAYHRLNRIHNDAEEALYDQAEAALAGQPAREQQEKLVKEGGE